MGNASLRLAVFGWVRTWKASGNDTLVRSCKPGGTLVSFLSQGAS